MLYVTPVQVSVKNLRTSQQEELPVADVAAHILAAAGKEAEELWEL